MIAVQLWDLYGPFVAVNPKYVASHKVHIDAHWWTNVLANYFIRLSIKCRSSDYAEFGISPIDSLFDWIKSNTSWSFHIWNWQRAENFLCEPSIIDFLVIGIGNKYDITKNTCRSRQRNLVLVCTGATAYEFSVKHLGSGFATRSSIQSCDEIIGCVKT